VDCFT